MSNSFKKILAGTLISCLILMLWAYQSCYNSSIDWEVTTTAEVIEFPAWILETELMTHVITGEKYLLSENYAGSDIKRNVRIDQAFLVFIWLGLIFTLVASTYLKRYAFFVVAALFALFLNRLNLFEVGLFGFQSKMIILIPFLAFLVPMVIFHEYKKDTPLGIRMIVFIAVSLGLLLGVQNGTLFTDHLIAHSLFGFTICGLLFLFIVSEEIIFSILYVVTSGKGGSTNHIHFLVLSLAYLGNLILYYLNKSGLFENSFFFFDPFLLLAITCLVSLWSLKFKASYLHNYIRAEHLYLLTFGLGIVTLTFISHQLIRGNDAVYEAFHYFILYFHIGFGALFFLYTLSNFIDPLIKGFEVHKIVYKERNFPYATARLGGIVAVLAFYFLAGQEPYNLLKSGYYNYLAEEAKTEGNALLSKEYTLQASYLGYNTHYANYTLGKQEFAKGSEYASKTYFYNAFQRFPSSYALINYGNLDAEINPNKVQAIFEEALRSINSGEIENNLGVIHLQKGELQQALSYFENADQSDKWNDAPLINKWHVLNKINAIDTVGLEEEYLLGNYGSKSNILITQTAETSLSFDYYQLEKARPLHRQAYLLNGSHIFSHDSISAFVRREIENSADAGFTNRLRKSLALHLYRKGQINEAFLILDYLQANAHPFYKGAYLDALGKLALDQYANQLALDYFEQAIDSKFEEAIFGKIEVMVRLGRKDEVPNFLLSQLKSYPELTNRANEILSRIDDYKSPILPIPQIPNLDSLSEEKLLSVGRSNAFHETQVITVVDKLDELGASGGYEILVDAIEINPYSSALLMKYSMVALNWNLVEYADQAVEKLQSLLSRRDFETFLKEYEAQKEEVANETW